MTDASRPLPSLDEPDTAPFWQATRDQQLRYQQCTHCGTIVFHPRSHCTGCTDGVLEWRVASGKGTLYTFSVIRQSYHPFFRQKVPYAIAWIDLDEGPRLLTNVTGVTDPANELHCGQRMEVEWETHETLSIPLFRPA
ncbi:MAG: Zn-ribbon domain-containing OB-fold protein [Pseudomonadales bacterium]